MRYRAALVASMVLLVGCTGTPMTLGGVTLLRHGVLTGSPAALNSGSIDFSTGCTLLAPKDPRGVTYVLIWPGGARLDNSMGVLEVFVDALALRAGDEVSVGGGHYKGSAEVEQFAGPIPAVCDADDYWLVTSIERLQ